MKHYELLTMTVWDKKINKKATEIKRKETLVRKSLKYEYKTTLFHEL